MAKKLVALLLAVAMVMSFALVGHAEDEIVDGKFTTTRHITVEVYDRGNDGGSDPTNNMYTEYIKKGMLEDHNVEVEFVKVPRWTEVEEINNLLAAQKAPDICVTYSYPTIQTYADMGGVMDLSTLLEENKDLAPNLWGWLQENNIYWDRDPVDDASKVVPYSVSYDVGWRAGTLIESFLDPNISDREFYINGFDDRKVTQNGTKEAVRLLNKWYNDGLLWDNFALYGSGDTTEDDNMKAGYVGVFTHNWDYPFRNGVDSINANLARNVGPDAKYVAIDPFTSSDGSHTKFVPGPVDRKVFFPLTNDEPLACLLYLDWISDPEHIEYLQIGDEGVTHNVLESGAIQTMAATGDAIMNSGMNIDYTITCNGLKLADPEKTQLSKAYNYAEIDPEIVAQADTYAQTDLHFIKNVNVGAIEAEAGIGDTLSSKRDQIFDQAVVAAPDQFDAVWDEFMEDYLSSGGQDIIDERTEKWEEFFGDAEMLP